MCGIAGILGKGRLIQRPILETMAEGLAHRGPDDKGIEIIPMANEKDIFLGLIHRRLSIIDLSSAAHQPMCNEDGTIWITYNGEIYNYKEIRAELKAKGYVFKSNSDTEVIIYAYQEWGVECLQKFHGMFAFAICDQNKKILFLTVDRFGIKPLYYYEGQDNLFLFSSEVRTILNSGFIKKQIEPLALDSFLAYGAIQAPLTIIKQIYSLLPAHYLIYNLSTRSKEIVQYWSISPKVSNEPLNDEDKIIQRTRDILVDSIQKHLVSDVPVGLFLSGGIDSSSIVALANRLKEGSLHSFSVTFPELGFSEEKYSRLIARLYCKNHTEIRLSQDDLINILPQAILAMDQPTVDGINTYVISKAVKDSGIKVVLSGQGGDEVFGGYSTFKRIPSIQRIYALVKYLPLSLRENVGNIIDATTGRSMIKSKVSQILESRGDIFSLCLILRQLFSPKGRKLLLKNINEDEMCNGLSLQAAEWLGNEIKYLDVFNSVSLLELRLYLANMLLRDGDFMSMAHSLEIRVPYLDHELVEFVFNVSSKMKLSNNLPKPLLVNSMRDLLPKEIYLRPKMGFTFPWEIWLRDKLRCQVEDLLKDFPVNDELGLDIEACQKVWDMFLQNKPGITWSRVWAIYVLLNWIKRNVLE